MAEQREFQAEVKQLLHLMIHSLYSNKEIFLRELISNASDAADKLRFESLKNAELLGDDADLRVEVEIRKGAREIVIRDNGIGMSHDDVVENLGTIASSGTRRFLESLSGDERKDSQLIGQFGVGFYSSYIVADTVTVRTRRADVDEGVEWISDGEGSYSIEAIEWPKRGTEITLHLRDGEDEFLEPARVRNVITRYSEHLNLPINLKGEGDDAEFETVNKGTALWARPKADIKDEEYTDLYKQISYDFEDPLTWSHNRVEGNLEYTSLLYIPARAPYDLWDRDSRRGLKLYVKRVFIMDDAEKLMPAYLRFVRGIIDSADLPLNVSRELLQSNRVIDKIRSASVKRVLGMIGELAKSDGDKFQAFTKAFGAVLKEGIVEDPDNRDTIAGLLRFRSTKAADAEPGVALQDYIERMPETQDAIYYVTAENLATAKSSPHLEAFKSRDIEVLLLTDRVDEWMLNALPEFGGKPLKSVARGDVDLAPVVEDPKAEGEKARVDALYRDVLERLTEALDGKVESVRLSQRLTESPACLVVSDDAMSRHLERLLKQAGESLPGSKPILEVNPKHPTLERLREGLDDDAFSDYATLLYGQAVLAEGGQIEDPAEFVRSLNRVMFAGGEATA